MSLRTKKWPSPQHVAGLVLVLSLPVISGSECVRLDAEPPPGGTDFPEGKCGLEEGMVATTPQPMDLVCADNESDLTHPCRCQDLEEEPPLVIIPKFDQPTGCHTDVGTLGLKYVLPHCAFIAELSGHVSTYWRFNDRANEPGDEDTRIDLCPDVPTMRVDPFLDGATRELRTIGTFQRSPHGAMHIEVQDCRWYDGVFTIPAQNLSPTLIGEDLVFSSRPATPAKHELFSVAGDWVADFNHNNNTSENAHAEIHEARALALVTPVTELLSVALPNAFFAEGTRQQDHIHLGIKMTPLPDILNDPINPEKWKLTCRVMESGFFTAPACGTRPNVTFQVAPDKNDKQDRCNIEIDRNGQRGGPEPLQFLCSDTCDEKRYVEDDGLFCNNVHFMNPVVGLWEDPGDLWMCQCSCDDPSASGATIAAAVQGCAQLGLDPTKPEDQQIACAQVCGGQICGAAPACRIGECHAPATSGAAQLIARLACDPTKPQPQARVSAAGDYHVTIDRNASSFVVHVNDELVNSTLDGTMHFNLNESGGIRVVDFANTRSFPDDFSIFNVTIANALLVSSKRVLGQLGTGTAFQIPAHSGSFFAQSLVAGKLLGEELLNPDPVSGTINVQTREFVMDIVAAQPPEQADEDVERAIVAHIVGTIDNIPPVAVSGGPTRTVECTSSTLTPVTLNGSSSFDTDPGDAISHYQWFTAGGMGMGNQAVVSTALPLGHSAFVLHVYDDDLGSAAAPLDINVVDSTAPTLTLSPQSACMWPPDHKRIRFRLGIDVTATATDACDGTPTVRIVNVTSSQPDNGPGDGNTVNDASFSDHAFCIRRERTPPLEERIYHVTIEARDASGNITTTVLPIRVATSNNGSPCSSIGVVIADDAPCE